MTDVRNQSVDLEWEINTEELGRYLLAGELEEWFNNELVKALRSFIPQDGVIDICFKNGDPIMLFISGASYDDELTCSKPLAGAIEEIIDEWGDDIGDDQCGPQLRRCLRRLREVLLAAVDKIDTTLHPYSDGEAQASC